MNPGLMTSKDVSSRSKEKQAVRPPNALSDSQTGSESPGFYFGAPADVPGVKKKTLNTMLNVPVLIPMRDLLALKPIQRVMQEYTLVKRVLTDGSAAGALAAVETEGKGEEEERAKEVAKDIQVACIKCKREEPEIQRLSMMPLTYVAVEVAEQVRLKGILDSRSQIITL
ncbi:hypothetical protein PISMIDRAFT_13889 [Pisolithus microcarpus 441]|uniref:Uncharacterized protein n=1 Tax=Pisolithus microcarpus 441 TaxID=765257 RepID=A0A0C9YYV6_9AGAM|nr:hypothetical protein BKA83DRAFT_13889 [Pisolithus microcarpus]KIK19129.1 hypothetical protein PISMIDRAFT_13889 [Pisolithus microcarpus 441]